MNCHYNLLVQVEFVSGYLLQHKYGKVLEIGRPGYHVTKQYDPETKQRSLLFQVEYPEIEDNIKLRHRLMSSYEQRVQPFNRRYQCLLFAAEPYEIIAFQALRLTNPHWDPDLKMFKAALPSSSHIGIVT
ncbi:hypothetical protein SLEP1_g53307 [Rubroshorea leprosula]|uniref:SF3A2 domain-containing protein n=1 Tax=Rubroshorea leprosula TaxID=152421 RepID=A0AAV5MA58_9ROSI|nr:hypothetical protein SLEP1_g53307 [Rubroshorea leprosula]